MIFKPENAETDPAKCWAWLSSVVEAGGFGFVALATKPSATWADVQAAILQELIPNE